MPYKDRRQVGVVSLFGYNNYGNSLQRHAVCHLVKDLGYAPVVLDSRRLSRNTWKAIVKEFFSRKFNNGDSRLKRFIAFDEDHVVLKARSDSALSNFGKSMDAIIVGSDQVWNPEFEFNSYLFFLEFIPKYKRIALSPSIGLNDVPADFTQCFVDGLDGFRRLSVREYEGAQLISTLSGRNADVLCDPTMAVDWSHWNKISSNLMTPNRPYILVYALGSISESLSWAKSKAADINGEVIILNSPDNQYINAGPAEFISLISNANAVVTDSFHAAVFSLMAHVPIKVFDRIDSIGSMNSRLNTLASTFNVNFDGEEKSFDWNMIDLTKEKLKQKLINYLSEELSLSLTGRKEVGKTDDGQRKQI